MPLLTPQQVADLRLELAKPGYAGLNKFQATDALNRPLEISNGPAPKVPIPLSTRRQDLISVISSPSVGKMTTSQLMDRVLNHIDKDDHGKFLLIVTVAAKGNTITGQESLELQRLAMQTQDDPNHQPTRIGPSAFQAIHGLGDVEITHPDGHKSLGTCTPEMIDEARAA